MARLSPASEVVENDCSPRCYAGSEKKPRQPAEYLVHLTSSMRNTRASCARPVLHEGRQLVVYPLPQLNAVLASVRVYKDATGSSSEMRLGW